MRIKSRRFIDLPRNPRKTMGEKSFVINDPNGVHVYIYEAIEPTLEYKKVYDSFK